MCFILKANLTRCMLAHAQQQQQLVKMGAGAPESAEDMKKFKAEGEPLSLPQHSYWFDFWAFLAFDIVFFLVMYFIVP